MVLGTDREDLPGTAEFVLPANQQNWSPLGFTISTFSTAAASCSSWPAAIVFKRQDRYTIRDLDLRKVSSIN
jgi:hypothetical protein